MLVNLGAKLLTEALLEELLMFSLKKLSKMSKTKVDDELVKIVEKHLN
ncbi:MAG: hypothetical protein GTO02_03295 [Candidatus Dadabacteria bacterium]|nr:hypothetical protein [Candidatus Dadabacteria bacterium]